MNFFLTLTLFVGISTQALAQKNIPYWLDPYQRELIYPNSRFLVGMSYELVHKKQKLSAIYERINQITRNQIIESIHVNVEFVTEMNISVTNSTTTQVLEQNSISISNAELVGLKVENYYNKKAKKAFSFSYVNIDDLIDFNLDIIQINTDAIDKNIRSVDEYNRSDENKEKAMILLYESQVKLREINKASVLLVALKQKNNIDFDKINKMKLNINQRVDNFLSHGVLEIHDIASFYAYELQLFIRESKIILCKGEIGYGSSMKESKFSDELNKQIFNKLGESELINISESGCDYILKGTFNKLNEDIILENGFVDPKGRVSALVSHKFPYKSVEFGGATFLPKNFNYIKNLSDITLTPELEIYKIKKTTLFNNPINIEVSLNTEPLADIPIHFRIFRGEKIELETIIITNKKGVAQLTLNTNQIKQSGELILYASLATGTLLKIDSTTDFSTKLKIQYPLQIKKIKLDIIKPTIYVHSNETSIGQPLAVHILESSVKNSLQALGYNFVFSPKEADFIIEIESLTRKGQVNQYAYFSYLDATISMTRTDTGEEIYKNSLTSVKGAGANFQLASAEAYEKAKRKIGNDIAYRLEYGD